MNAFLKHLTGLHDRVAADVCADKYYHLRCKECRAEQSVSPEQFSRYLKGGWPKCCGQTMSLEDRGKP